MKYIITDKDEVRTGSESSFHVNIADGCLGKVNRAGHYDIVKETGDLIVYGESVGYHIRAKETDIPLIRKALGL